MKTKINLFIIILITIFTACSNKEKEIQRRNDSIIKDSLMKDSLARVESEQMIKDSLVKMKIKAKEDSTKKTDTISKKCKKKK